MKEKVLDNKKNGMGMMVLFILLYAVAAAAVVKQEGKPNDMIARVEADPAFGLSREEIEAELSPEAFTGRSAEQVTEFLRDVIQPVLDANKEDLGQHVELSV